MDPSLVRWKSKSRNEDWYWMDGSVVIKTPLSNLSIWEMDDIDYWSDVWDEKAVQTNFLMMYGGDLFAQENGKECTFICGPTEVTGKKTILMEFKKVNLTFSLFHLEYRFEAPHKELLDKWGNKRMTGFNMTWYLRNGTGAQVNHKPNSVSRVTLSTEKEKAKAKNSDTDLNNAILLSRHLRANKHMSQKEILEWVITEKINASGFFKRKSCLAQQYSSGEERGLIEQLLNKEELTDKNKQTDSNHNSEDVATGFKVYSALLFCPESAQLETLKPYRFLSNLVKIQSLPSIVGSIVSARGQGVYSVQFTGFYHKLEELLGLQYLLVKSPERLNSIWKKDWSQVMNRGKQCQSSKCAGENTEIEGEWLIEYW